MAKAAVCHLSQKVLPVCNAPPQAASTRLVFQVPELYRIYVVCATTERNRMMARPKNKAPMTATARNWGHTTSSPAPR